MWGLYFIPGSRRNTYHFINILYQQVALSAKKSTASATWEADKGGLL